MFLARYKLPSWFCPQSSPPANMSEEEITQSVNEKKITCGSTLRIQNDLTKYYLSSFGMNWSTGSRLQIVTGVKESDKYESLFIIKEGEGLPPCENGEPIKCGSIIRLEHVTTGKNIHSHEFPSFITNTQEACAFGDNRVQCIFIFRSESYDDFLPCHS